MLRHALAITLEALGEGHPDTATSYNNVAATLLAQGKPAEAEAMHRRALAIGLKALGEAHPDTAQGYCNLALSLELQGKHDEAPPDLAPRRGELRAGVVTGAQGARGDARRTLALSPASPPPWPAPGSRARPGRVGNEAWPAGSPTR